MKTRKTNRMLALFVSLCMVVGMLPMTGMTLAAEPCPNHAAHDDTCGFAQAVEGHDCGHAHDDTCGYAEGMGDAPCKHEQGEHDESCGYAPPSEETPCGHTHDESCGEPDENGEYPGCAHGHDGGCGYAPASEGTPCAHQEHDGDCGYVEAKEGAACRHAHDADCGYIAAVEGKPCGHTCELCDGSEAENALPFGEELAATYSISGQVKSAATREPIEGITVTLSLWPDGGQINSTITDQEGKYSFASLSPGEYYVKTGGQASDGASYAEDSWVVIITDSDNTGRDFKLEPGNTPGTYSISGSVRDNALRFLPDISVTLWQGDQQVGSVNTDWSGKYSFTSLAPETYTVKAGGWSRGVYYIEQSETVIITDSDQSCSFTLEPGNVPGTYSISGTVKEKNYGNVRIDVTLWQGDDRVGGFKTDSNGSYILRNLTPGEYTVKVGGGDSPYIEQSKTLTITDKDVEECDFELVPSDPSQMRYLISGNVKEKNYGGVRIDVTLWQGETKVDSFYTDDNGNYSRSVVLGEYTVKVGGGDSPYTEQSKTLTIIDRNVGGCDFELVPSDPSQMKYLISGNVKEKNSGGVRIEVTVWQGDDRVGGFNTDSNGNYIFHGLTPGEYTVKVGGGDSPYIEQSKTLTIIDRNVGGCDFELVASDPSLRKYSISGSVNIAVVTASPLNGIGVTLWQGGQQVGGVNTDTFGQYSFISLAPGAYTVKAGGWSGGVYYIEQSQTATITDSNTRCTFSLKPGNAPGTYSVSGNVEGRSSAPGSFPAPIPNVPVELWQNGKRIGSTVTAISGTISPEAKFSFSSITPGSYTLRVPAGTYGGAYQLEYLETIVVENENVKLGSITLRSGNAPDGYAVSGKIQNATGGGLQGVPVQLLNSNVKMIETTTGADGSFSFPKVNDATYTLKIPAGIYAGAAYREATKAITVSGQNLSVEAVALSAAAVPGVPQKLTANPGIGQVALSWTDPASDGGAAISGYQVSEDNGANWTNATSATGHTFTNLSTGKSYTFQVRAVNSVGAGEAASVTATPTAPGPSAPQNLYAQYGNQILYLHWKAPANNGGSAIVKYQYSATADGRDDWKDIPDSGPDTVTYTVTGLTNGTTYTLKVRAVNSNGGVGEAASTTLAPQPVAPSAPRNLNATPGDGQMLLAWDPPESNGGSPITRYQYRYNVDPNSSGAMQYWTNMPDSGPDTVSFTVTGLVNGKELVFWVRAVSDSGFSPHARVMGTPQAGATAPGAPQNFQANPGDQQVDLSWEAPASNGGAAINGYQVSKDGGANWEEASSNTGHTFTGLTNGKSYTFQVRAVNSAGQGEAAEATATPQAGATAPGVPLNFNANPGDKQVELSWTAPASNGGAEITKYEVSKDNGTSWEEASSETGHTFTDLTNGQSYTFQVRAVNSIGTGAAASATATPQAETPATFTLTVENGTDITGSGPYAEGAKVNIRANVPKDGKLFKQWASSGGGSFDDANSPETTFTMPAEAVTVTATYENDTTAPTGTISVKDNGWSKFWNTITFGVFFKETQEVAITAQDDSGQDVAIAYHMANAALTLDQVQALAEGQWTAYTDKFSIAPNAELVIYARLTDKAGNVTYISSEGIVLDNTPPAFSLEDGKTYDSAQTLTVSDSYLKSVTLDGAPQTLQNNACTVTLDTNGSYTIEATDKAGNTASITVTIDIPVVTAPNLTGITAPAAITGVANGTPLADISLPDKVAITTTEGDKQASVTWSRNVPAYNPASETAQTFTISGNVTLPDGVTNTNGVSLTVTISVTVEAKGAVTVTGLEITRNPNKAAYTEGEALDLTGLSVKLTFSDGSDKTVALADFAANNITATPANGTKLSLSDTTVTVSAGGKSASFKITVNALEQVQTPSFSPAGGAYEAAQEVEITCGTPGAKIHYTTDGNAPTANSTLYAGPITVSKTTTINAIAIKDGMKNSAEASATYTINTTPPPVVTVPGAPQSLKATPGDKQVELSWTAPASNGGAEITKYEVSKDNGANWTDATSATGHTFTGLNNGQSYTFRVRAVNSEGAGAEVSVTATPSAAVYHLTVTNGRDITDSGPYQEGARVRIQADAATSGWTFDKWTGGANGIFDSGSRTSSTTTITMPAGDVAVTATYKKINNGGGSSTGGGGSSSGSGDDSAGGSAITAPKSNYTVTGDKISQTVSRTDLKKLADSGKSLTLNSGSTTMTFDPAALKAILAAVPATAGNITFAAAPADISAFPEAAKLIGNRPVFNYTISYKDSKGNTIPVNVNFPAGSASISLNYTPAEGEVTGNLFMVYVDGKGAVTWLDKSSYSSGKVLADVPHFSIYGVAYKAPAAVFTDITGHWAKADMEFVAARGLLSGTGEKVFSPDAAMTRGMFVTALGRLAGVNPASYQTRSFTDVKADAYYAAYVEWAAQKNIVKGTGEGLFSPDAPVTREQMAVMMTNYAGQMGYSIPATLAAVTFADNDKISAWAAKEVAAMQRSGIIKGKDGNRFDPQGNATRAEVSAVLRRFVEIVIDPVTAQGWVKNDSGQWLYYKDGKAITGWKQLGGKWYYFDKNGIMAVNTKIDGYKIGPDGARKEE